MAKDVETVPLNVRVPRDVRRRLLIAKANTGSSIQDMVVGWIEAGLAKIEREQLKGK